MDALTTFTPLSDRTIAAVSTPHGTGGIAVIRLSGPDAFAIADKVWRGKRLAEAGTHTAHFGNIVDREGRPVDSGIATIFRAPGSYTGEDTVEFAVHGSPWIQREVVNLLIEAGASAAEQGEFTRRAFMNGRLDLAQAEGVADMIASSSKAANRLAQNQMSGGFSKSLNSLRDRIITLSSLLELELDFSEEDVEFADRIKLKELADETASMISRLASTYRSGRAIKEGVKVVIAGRPNAGKSTLLNRLLGEEKAIVSEIPGTTRDIIEDSAEINGILYRFFDTAGLRDSDDLVERIGIDRAKERLRNADIILLLHSSDTTADTDAALLREVAEIASANDIPLIKVTTKSDLSPTTADAKSSATSDGNGSEVNSIAISAKTGSGIDTLLDILHSEATGGIQTSAEVVVTNARHYEELRQALEALDRFREAMTAGLPADLLAEDLGTAVHHIGAITGAITTDTLLHTIFSRFCIGK